MCVYVCMYVCVCVCVCPSVCPSVCLSVMYVCIYLIIYLYILILIYMNIHVCVYIFIYIHVCFLTYDWYLYANPSTRDIPPAQGSFLPGTSLQRTASARATGPHGKGTREASFQGSWG